MCFALREVSVVDGEGVSASWSSTTAGANKPQNTRPLALFPDKESKELLEEFIPLVEAEVTSIKEDGVTVKVGEMEVQACCKSADLSMADGKMVTTLLRLGGAYCSMCVKSQVECHDLLVVQEGFLIDRSIESLTDLALSLTDKDTGEVIKSRGDYATRQGICDKPITTSDLTKNIPVCHSKIRTTEWLVELLVRYKSHQKWSTATNRVKYSKEEKEDYGRTRLEVQELLYQNLAINIGDPGDMVTGNAFAKLAADPSRQFLCSLVKEEIQDDFGVALLGLCAAVKVVNLQKRKVNIDKLRQMLVETYCKLLICFPWCAVSPSVHRILAHSWEVIQLNDGFGLGNLSEEGLEVLNKYVRSMRETGARKDCTLNNFRDTFNHLWDRSRPTIVEMARQIKRRGPRLCIMTEIEVLVETLFIEEEE